MTLSPETPAPSTDASPAVGAAHHDAHHGHAYSSLVNAIKLGGSLLLSWAVALVVRPLLVRHLGETRWGESWAAESIAAVALLPAALGLDTWIRKEVGITIKNANGFFGGALVLRFIMLVLFGAMGVGWGYLHHNSAEVLATIGVFAVAQFLFLTNQSLAALLHTGGKVNGLSVVTVVGKVLWGGLIVGGVMLDWPLWGFALALVVSELAKALATWKLAADHVGLTFTVDVPATKKMFVGALPFYVNAIALGATGRIDTTILESFGDKAAVGWYGVVLAVMGIALVISPVVGWVLTPLLARAGARSSDELYQVTRRVLEGCLAAAVPITLVVALGAELWLRILYGERFIAAAPALQALAPAFALTYLNIVVSICLTALNRGWSVTITSLSSLALTPVLNLILIPVFWRLWGPIGGTIACAVSLVATETFTTGIMLWRMGSQAFDARTVTMLVKTGAVSAVCIAMEVALRQVGLHQVLRLLLEATVYVVGVVALRAVRPNEVIGFLKTARARRAQPG